MTSTSPIVQFNSYNPYEARYPSLKCVPRETLHLIKELRSRGYRVVVLPDDGRPLMYITEKGMREFFSDPLRVFIVNIPLTIILGLLANSMYDQLKNTPSQDTHIVIEVDDAGRRIRYDHTGQPISDDKFSKMLHILEKRQIDYADSLTVTPPDPQRPYPIYLEHTSKIIGWGMMRIDDRGLLVEDAKITDKETLDKIDRKEINGFSIGAIVHEAECSICQKDYIDCNHIAGKIYNKNCCTAIIKGAGLADISVVKDPVNSECTIRRKNGN